ncbi:MAG TPA: aminopeptidase P N-terminal domain-containing protein, partial [Chitinophagaceae bacterium]|nr:aminopeptidase P N-terminal domain-containing protein [Chitinophagaceae bacterium]
MKKNRYRLFAIICFLGASVSLQAQDSLPTDYLSKDFHAGRREALRKLMPDNSVFIVMAYPTRTFSNDVEYLYHQNPDMYYFSGYKEPHSLLLIFKEEQKGIDGAVYREI